MNQKQADKLAKKKYGPTARAEKPILFDHNKKPYNYCCPFMVYKSKEIMGWGHSWKQALSGPCPHFEGKWPPEPVTFTMLPSEVPAGYEIKLVKKGA